MALCVRKGLSQNTPEPFLEQRSWLESCQPQPGINQPWPAARVGSAQFSTRRSTPHVSTVSPRPVRDLSWHITHELSEQHSGPKGPHYSNVHTGSTLDGK